MADITINNNVNTLLHTFQRRMPVIWLSEDTGFVLSYGAANGQRIVDKSTNGGLTWATVLDSDVGKADMMDSWFDRWTPGNTGSVLHIVTISIEDNSVDYLAFDVATEETIRTVQISTQAWDEFVFGHGKVEVGIVRSRGGNLYVNAKTSANGGTGNASIFMRSTDEGVTWTSRSVSGLVDTFDGDRIFLIPGDETDNQDVMAIYLDQANGNISFKVHDDSGNSWLETAVDSSGLYTNAPDSFWDWDVIMRDSDNAIFLLVWERTGLNLRLFQIAGSAGAYTITTRTNVLVTTGGSRAGLYYDVGTSSLYAVYIRGSGGTLTIYYKVSTDNGATWGSEQTYSETTDDYRHVGAGYGNRLGGGGRFMPVFFNDDLNDVHANQGNSISFNVPSLKGTVHRGRMMGF